MSYNKLRKIKIKLKQFGISFNIYKDFMIMDFVRMKKVQFEKIKQLIYCILDSYEKYYFILIKGLPYCLMPDAHDHIIYTERKSESYRSLQQCKLCKYFAVCPGIKQDKEELILPALMPILNYPLDIAIEVNKTCNLGCKFCIYNYKDKQIALSYNKIREVLDEAKKLNIKYVRFTGGEPLLRADILKILKYAKSKEFYVFLNTNGTLIDNYTIKELEECIDNILVSLCGYNTYTESILNTRGNLNLLKNKFNNILKLRRSKIPYIRIGTVISKLLIDNFDRYSILIKALGIKTWELYRPMLPLSTAKEYFYYDITKNDLLKLIRLIYKLRKSGINVYIANALPFCITNKNIYKTIMRGAQFDDGHCRLVLDSKGFFKPSYFIEKNLGLNIKEAWNHPFIKRINTYEYLPRKCKRCSYLRWCLGGSRFIAKEYFDDYFAYDPLMEN